MDVEVEVQKLDNHQLVCPIHAYDIKPTYYVWAGLVFTHLTLPLLRHEFGSISRGPPIMCHKAFYSKPEKSEERIVIIPTILDHPINISYETSHKWSMVEKVNGVKVTNCKQVMDIIDNAKTPYIRIDCVETGPIVMKKELADKANKEIMRTHSVYSLKSEDLGGKFPSLGGEDEKEEEPAGLEAVIEGFESLHAQGMKILDKMGIPKNGPSAKAALAGIDGGGETDLLSFLANARCVLDNYAKTKAELFGGDEEAAGPEENEK